VSRTQQGLVATSVFVVAITALVAAGGHLFQFVQSGGDVLGTIASIVIFAVPGVIIGAQPGSWATSRIPQRILELTLGILFIGAAVVKQILDDDRNIRIPQGRMITCIRTGYGFARYQHIDI